MADSKIVGYKKVFGFVLPDWVDEKSANRTLGYVLVSVVMMFVILLVINPNKDNVLKLEAQYKTESERLETMKESKKSLDRLVADIAPNEQEAVFRAMPLDYSPETAVASFRRVANAVGVSVVEYALPGGVVYQSGVREFGGSSGKDKETAIDFKSFLIQVTVEGQISGILNFIDRVQKSLPMAFVSDLAIQEVVRVAEMGKSQSNVNLRLSVQYYQPVPKSINVAGLQNFTPGELALMKEISGYATEILPLGGFEILPVQGGGVRNLFGQ